MAGNTIANAWVQLMPSFRGGQRAIENELNGPLDGAGRSGGRRFGDGMRGAIGGMAASIFGPLAAAAASISLVSILKDAVNQASDLEEAGTKLNAIFGTDGAAAVQSFADAGAKALGQNRLAVLDSAATFGTFGKAAGLTGTELASFSTELSSLSTDLASFYNASPEEAAEAIGSALRGEAEPMRRFGVLLDDASLRAEALKQGLISTTKDALTPQQKILAAQALIFAQTSDAQGDFARTSGGLANQQRILSAQWTDMKGRLGAVLLPAVTGFVTFLNNNLVPGVEKAAEVFKPLGKAVTGVFDILAKGDFTGLGFEGISDDSQVVSFLFQVRDALLGVGSFITGTVVPAFQSLAAVVGPIIVGYLREMGGFIQSTVIPALVDIGTYVATNVVPALVEFGTFIGSKLLPVLGSIGSFILTSVVPALQSIYSTVIATVVPVLKSLWETFEANVLPALQNFFGIITDKVVPVILRIGEALLPVIATVIKFVGAFLQHVIPVILNVVGPVFGFLINALGTVIGWLADFIGWVIDAIEKTIPYVQLGWQMFMMFKDRIVAALTAVWDNVVRIFTAVRGFITNAIANVVGVAAQIIAFKDRVVNAFTNLRDEAISRIVSFVAEVRGIPAKAMEAIGNLASTLKQKGKDLIQGLIDGIKDKIQSVKNAVGEVASAIGDFFPGSPVKDGPLRKWNNGMAGKRLVGMLADGLADTSAIEAASRGLASAVASPVAAGGMGATSAAAIGRIHPDDIAALASAMVQGAGAVTGVINHSLARQARAA